MATFGQIPSDINFSKMNVVADIVARDALTGMVQGDVCFVNGLGDNGISYFYNGTVWVPHSGQMIEKITLGATGTITFNTIISGFSKLMIRYSIRGVRANTVDTLFCFIDGDTTAANYHRQNNYAANGVTSAAETAEPAVSTIPAANSPANLFGTGEIHFVNYDEASRVKHVFSTFVALEDTDSIRAGMQGMVHDGGSIGVINTSLALDGENADLAAGSWAELWGF